jgi:hypothetical protein
VQDFSRAPRYIPDVASRPAHLTLGLGLLLVAHTACVNDPLVVFEADEPGVYCEALEVTAATRARSCGYRELADVDVLAGLVSTCRDAAATRKLDTRRAARCIEDVERIRCSSLRRLTPSDDCLATLVGEAPIGQRCQREADCAAGAYCAFTPGTCGGTCTAERTVGDTCEVRRMCPPGSSCLGRCSVPSILGAQCAGETCRLELICAASLVCELPRQVGETCGTATCADGLVCIDGECVFGAKVGEACASDGACISGACSAGVCAPLPGLGERCVPRGVCQVGSCVDETCAVTTSSCS